MMEKKIIGIRGHRGAGKESVAQLLAYTLDFIDSMEHIESNLDDYPMYSKNYDNWVKDIKQYGEPQNYELENIYIDSFGDTPKAMVQQLLGCDFKYLWEEYWKDHAVVDLRTFNIEEVEELPKSLVGVEDMIHYHDYLDDPNITISLRMSLRDFILYFGISVMQKYFGQNVWVKSTAQNDKMNERNEVTNINFQIYKDIKAPSELSYVIERGGTIINVERKGYKKNGGLDLLKDDNRYDYLISIKGDDLLSIKDTIWKIANKIYWNDKEK